MSSSMYGLYKDVYASAGGGDTNSNAPISLREVASPPQHARENISRYTPTTSTAANRMDTTAVTSGRGRDADDSLYNTKTMLQQHSAALDLWLGIAVSPNVGMSTVKGGIGLRQGGDLGAHNDDGRQRFGGLADGMGVHDGAAAAGLDGSGLRPTFSERLRSASQEATEAANSGAAAVRESSASLPRYIEPDFYRNTSADNGMRVLFGGGGRRTDGEGDTARGRGHDIVRDPRAEFGGGGGARRRSDRDLVVYEAGDQSQPTELFERRASTGGDDSHHQQGEGEPKELLKNRTANSINSNRTLRGFGHEEKDQPFSGREDQTRSLGLRDTANGAGTNAMIERRAAVSNSSGGVQEVKRRVRGVGSQGIRGAAERGDGPTNAGMQRKSSSSDFKSKWREAVDGRVGEGGHQSTSHPPPSASLPLSSSSTHAGGGGGPDAYNGVGGGFDARVQSYSGITGQGGDDSGTRSNLPESVRADLDQYVFNHRHNNNDDYNYGSQPAGQHYYGGGDGRVGYTSSNVTVSAASESGGLGVGIGSDVERGGEWGPQAEGYTQRYPQQHYPYEHYENQNEGLLISQQQRLQLGDNSSNLLPPLRPPLAPSSTPQRGGGGETMGSGARRGGAWGATMAAGASVERDTFPTSSSQQHLRWDEEEAHSGNQPYQQDAHQKGTSNYGRSNDQTISQPFRYQQHHHEHHHAGATGQAVPPVAGDTYADWASVLDMGSGGGGGTAYNNATAATPPAPSPPTTTAAYGYYPSEEQDHGSHRHNHYQHDDDYRHHFENGEEGQGQHQGGAGVGVGVVGSGLHHPQSAPRFGGMAATEDLIDRALQPSLARPTASNIKTNTNASATVTPKHGVANVVSNTPVAMLMPTPTPTPLPPLQHQDTMMRPATNSIPSGIFGHDNSSPVDRTPSMMSTVVQGNGGATLLRGTLASPQQHGQRRFILHQPQPSRPTIDGGGPVQDGATETNIRRSTSRSGLRRDVDSDDPRQQHHHDAIDRDDIAEATRDMSPQQNVSDALADDHRSLVHRDGSNIDSTAIVGMGEEALYSLRDGDGDGDGGGGGHQHLVYSEGNAEAEAERYISEDHHRDPHAHYAHPQVSYAAHHAARHDDSHTQDHHYHYHDPPEQMNPLYYESMRGGSGESHDFDRHFKPQHQLIVDEEPPLSPYFGVTGGSVTGGEGFDDNRYPQYTVSVRHDEIAYQGRREYKERAYPPHLLHHHENNGNERHQEYQQHYLTLSSPHDAYHPMMMETSGREAWADQYARDEDHTTNRGALAGAPSHRSLLAYPPQQQQHSSPPPDIPHVVATYAGGMDPLPPPRRGGLGVGGVVSIGTPAPHPSLLQRQQGQRHDTITDSSSHHHYHHIAENESIGNNNGSLRAVDSFAAQVNAAMSKMTRNDAAAAAKIDRNTNGHPFDTKKKHSGNAAAVADTSVFEPSEKNSTNDGTSDRKEGKETVVTGGSQRISRTHSRYSVMAQTPSSGAVVLQNGNNKNRGYDGKTTSTSDTNNTQGHAHDHNSIDLHNSAVRSYLPTPTFYDVKEMLAKEEAEAAARKQAEEKAHALEERKEQEARAQAAREAEERDKAAKAQFEHDQEERRAQAQQDMERRVAALEKEAEDTKAKARQLELALLLKEREIQKSITHVQQSPPTPSNVGRQPSTASRTAEATFAATTLAEPKKEKTDKIISSIHEEVERTTTGTGIRPAVVASRTASQHSQPPRPASAAERCSSIVGNYSPQAPSALASVLVDRTQHQRAVSTQVTPVPSSSNARPFLSLNARNTADSYYHRAATVVSVAEVQTDPLQGRHLVSTGVSARTPTPTNSSEAIVLVSHSSSPTSAPTGPDEDAASTRRHPMPQEADGTHPELAASSSTATLPFSSPLLQSPKSTRGVAATASSVFDSSSPVPTNMTNNKSVMPDAEEKQHHLQSSGHSKPIDSRSERNHQGVGKMESRGKDEGEGPFPSTVGVDYSGSAVQRLYGYADATPATHSIQGVDSRQESRNSATTPTAGSSARDTIRALEEKLDRLVREQEGLRRANQEARRLFFSDHTYDTYATGAMHNREENSSAFFLSSPVPHMPSATVSERTASLRALVDKTPVQKHAAAAHYAYRSHNSTVAAASTPTRRADGSIAVVGDGMDESKHVMQRAQLDAMMAEKAALLESLKEENRGLRTRAREARGMSKPSV